MLCLVELLDEFDVVSQDAYEFSFGAPDEDKVSLTASGDGHLPSDAEDSTGLPPSGVEAQSEFDAELATMLARAAVGIGLEWNPPPCPEWLDDWYLGSNRDSQPCPAPVSFLLGSA